MKVHRLLMILLVIYTRGYPQFWPSSSRSVQQNACTVGANDAHPAGKANLAADVLEDHGSIIVVGEEHIPAIKFRSRLCDAILHWYSMISHVISTFLHWKWKTAFSARFFSSITGFAAEWPFRVPAPKAFFGEGWMLKQVCLFRKKGIAYPNL